MSRSLRQSAAVATLVSVLACGSGLTPVNPPSFIRPERVAFTCVRTTKAGERVPVPMEQCSPCTGHPLEHSLYAFVTQTTRGELAAVDLKARQVIDTQTTVPGYTFVPVGEAPSALVVPAIDPKHTYVVNVGSSDLRILDTQRLLGATATTASTLAIIPLGQLTGDVWQEAEPVDMVLSTDEQRLVIASPSLHALIVIEVADLDRVVDNDIGVTDLPQTIVPLSGLTDVATVLTATDSDRYDETCRVTTPQPSKEVGPRDIPVSTADALPTALTLDAENNRVLVADAALPIIHAIDLDTLTEVSNGDRPLYVTGVPTLDVVIGPQVPVSPNGTATERYIYAIDAEQRSVLVLNDSGVMQSVNATGIPDRINFGSSGALSIEVIEPGYRECAPSVTAVGPRILRGVFLAASMIDGSIRIADVYDAHAEIRCAATSTGDADGIECSADDPCAAIHRHRPRIGAAFPSRAPCMRPVASSGLNLAVTLTAAKVGEDTQSVPSLVELSECAGASVPAYERVTTVIEGSSDAVTLECAADLMSEARKPLVCVNADPWAMGTEAWTAQWEGPTTNLGSGTLNEDGTTFETEMNLCAAGVLGDGTFQIEIGVPLADKATRDMFDPGHTTDNCSLFAARQADGTDARLTLPITGATFNTLTLGAAADVPAGFTADNVLAEARYCSAGMRLSFVVRSRGRYTVLGDRSGYVHRVIRGTDDVGICVLDPSADPLRVGQAIPGEPFTNATIAFEISALPSAAEPAQDMRFRFPTVSFPGALLFAAGATSSAEATSTIVPELRYSPTDTRLYAVDSAARGLMPISLSPLPTNLASSSVFR